MRFTLTRLAFSAVMIIGAATFSAAALAEVLTGRLIELSSVDSSITVELEGASPEKRFATYKVGADARWHICLTDRCINQRGVEGFKTVNEYAGFEAYGIPHQSYGVTLNVKDKEVKELEVQIVPRVH